MAVVASGAIGASAASKSSQGITFEASITMPSNAPLSFIDVSDAPVGTVPGIVLGTNAHFEGVIDTDGSGKIEGSGFQRIVFGPFKIVIDTNAPGSTNILASGVGDYNVSVSGKVSTKNNLPNVQESLKGTGYASVPTNVVAVIGDDGSYAFFFGKSSSSSSFNVTFTGNAAAVLVTNGVIDHVGVTGNLKGSVKPGKSINNGKSISVNEASVLPVDLIKLTEIPLQVVKLDNKIWANVIGANINGSGSINNGNGSLTANFKGFGSDKGASLKVTGTKGDVIIITGGGTTNTVAFVNSANLSGKIEGQTVSATGATVVQFGGF